MLLVATPPHSSPEMRRSPFTTEKTFFGSSYLLSRVQVYQPVRSLPLKSGSSVGE